MTRPILLAAVLTAALLAPAATAGAATLSFEGDTLVYRAAPGEQNSPILGGSNDAGWISVSEVASTPFPAGRCRQPDPDFAVECEAPARVDIELGDGDDNLDFSDGFPASIPVDVHGGDGDDLLEGNWDAPTPTLLDGQGGADKLEGRDGPETLAGGAGNDELIGSGGDDVLLGGDGADVLKPDYFSDSPGNDVVDGGPGVDLADDWTNPGANDNPAVSITMDGQANDGRPGETDNVVDVEKLVSAVSGTFSGTEGPDEYNVWGTLDGGDSTVLGNGGNDKLAGEHHSETLDGGTGDDRLEGGYNNDTITGGPGRDTIYGDDTSSQCGVLQSCTIPFGNDTILARDGEEDVIDCGVGQDKAVVDAIDVVAGCEDVDGAGPGGSGAPGSGAPGGSGGGPAQPAAPSLGAARGARLKAALRKGLVVDVTGASQALKLTATVDKVTARKLKLGKRAAAVARGTLAAGKASARLKFTKQAARKLKRLKRVTLTVRAPGAAPIKITLR